MNNIAHAFKAISRDVTGTKGSGVNPENLVSLPYAGNQKQNPPQERKPDAWDCAGRVDHYMQPVRLAPPEKPREKPTSVRWVVGRGLVPNSELPPVEVAASSSIGAAIESADPTPKGMINIAKYGEPPVYIFAPKSAAGRDF